MATPFSPPPIRPSVSESHHEGLRSPDQDSIHSNSPLQSPPTRPTYPPPLPSQSTVDSSRSRHVRIQQSEPDVSRSIRGYDAERAQTMPMPEDHAGHHYTHNSRSGSWDLLAGIRKFEHSYEEFTPSNASQSHLAFAEGDMPKNKVCAQLTSLLRGKYFWSP